MAAEAPVASPPPSPTIVDTGPPPPAPAPKGEIHVSAATIDKGPAQPPPKKGSAQDRLFAELRKKAKPQFFESAPTDSPTPDTATPPDPGASTEGAVATDTSTTAPSTEAKTKEKVNPWKLVDEYKAKASKTEARLKELESGAVTPEKVKEFQTQMEGLRKQNEELEKEIRFVNYQKSDEFKTKYQAPYEKAWTRAAKELSELVVPSDDGGERPATVNDLATIVNLPLGKARAVAEQVFGSFADDVMGYRKEILGLYEQQQTALEEARSKSIERDKTTWENNQRGQGERAKMMTEAWNKANEKIVSDPKFGELFRQIEGDQDGNERLAKGFAMVDGALSQNPDNPDLSSDQRAAIVERQAAVRMRAAAFGRVNAQRIQALQRIEQLEKIVAQYKGTVPPTGGTSGPDTRTEPRTSGWDSIRAGLQKIAKPQ